MSDARTKWEAHWNDGLQSRWNDTPFKDRAAFYAKEIAPLWAPVFGEIPFRDEQGVHDLPCDVLISVLGMSWQPVMLMGARLRPKHWVLLCTQESRNKEVDGEDVTRLIPRLAGVDRGVVEPPVIVQPHAEADIYRAVQEYRERFAGQHIVIDPTGGLKSMSASAALAGFYYGLRMVYVDSDQRDNGIPRPGSEYPRVLRNPLDLYGDKAFARITEAFDAGRFEDAAIRAEELAETLLNDTKAAFYAGAARAYGAWDRFEFAEAQRLLQKLADRFGKTGTAEAAADALPPGLEPILARAGRQIEVLNRLKSTGPNERWEHGLDFVFNHLAATRRRLDHGDTVAALVLLYSTVERFVVVRLQGKPGVHGDQVLREEVPNDVKEAYPDHYHELHDRETRRPDDLPRKVNYASGIALLAAYGDGAIQPESDFPWLLELGKARNTSGFQHGLVPKPVPGETVEQHYRKVLAWLGRALGEEDCRTRLDAFRFPTLS